MKKVLAENKKTIKILLTVMVLTVVILAVLNWPAAPLPNGYTVDRILIEKQKHTLTMFQGMRPIVVYRVSLGMSPHGHKLKEGDDRTPEGIYHVEEKNSQSGYYLSLQLTYPELEDIIRAESLGFTPGFDIAIHGLKNGFGWLGKLHRIHDWTYGCISVTNTEMKRIFHSVETGTLVEIRP